MGNPLYNPSELPFGLPDFAAMSPRVLKEAFLAGVRQESAQWEEIANNTEVPTAENTVGAVDAAGPILKRTIPVFYTLLSSVGGVELGELFEELAPRLAAHEDDFWLNRRIYQRYKTLAGSVDLDAETAWLVQVTVEDFERRGVNLDESGQKQLRELNGRIASLQAQVDAKITKQLDQTVTVGDDLLELEGLTPQQVEMARKAGAERGHAWALPVLNYSQPPLIASLANAGTRRRAFTDSISRGFGRTGEDELDTRTLIVALARLRARRARLLGFDSHSDLALAEQTVPSPEAARALLSTVGKAAVARLEEESSKYREAARADGVELGAPDWAFYEEKARSAALGLDPEALREYFELDSVITNGLFYAAGELYGLEFRARPDLKGWTEDVRVWEVFAENGRPLGLFLADYYTRPGKSGGAWMSELQAGCGREGSLPIVTNDANFDKPKDGQPTLLTWDQVETCFHEFGHALHGLLSNTYYSATAGTEVPSDFVELPSQLNEMWAYNPQVLARYAKHYKTGEPLPEATARKLAASRAFGQAFATLEYVQSALIDQWWHREEEGLPDGPQEVAPFEAEALESFGVAHDLVVPRYRGPYFAHTFAGGYDAGYYSYMWAEAMVGELEEWFADHAEDGDGGLNRAAGQVLRDELLARGNSRDPLRSFVAVKGRLPEGEAVVRRRCLG